MTSVSLEKTMEYLIIQESLRYRNLIEIIYVKEYFYVFFSTLKDIIQVQRKINP